MKLGGIAQVPREIGGALNQGRRQAAQATEYNPECKMPVSTRHYSA